MRKSILTILLWCCVVMGMAQETTLVQVKTFDQNLKSIPNLKFSLDRQVYFETKKKGETFAEITTSLLPPNAIYIADTNLEAESWNYSNGILEIIVRIKKFEIYNFTVLDASGQPLKGVNLKLDLKKPVEARTNNKGIVQLPIPINTTLQVPEVFRIEGYQITESKLSGTSGTVTAMAIAPEPVEEVKPALVDIDEIEPVQNSNESQLDSIQTLTAFYAYLRSINMAELDDEQKKIIDDKFGTIMNFTDSVSQVELLKGRISDSSLVSSDIVFLTEQALRESRFINETRGKFNKQVEIINNKIVEGGGNLSDSDRDRLLNDLATLDKLLLENEALFTQNQSYYKLSINELKNKLLNIQDLEEQLSASELQRLAEQRGFRNKLFIAAGIVVGLALLTLFFIYLARRFNKQKNALSIANAKVKSVNENLESIVAEKTKSLVRVNEELETFLYKSAHDLKRPLTSIIGLADIGLMTVEGDSQGLCSLTKETASDMNKLLDRLKIISQINHVVDFSIINFPEMMDEIMLESKDLIVENSIYVSCEIEDDIDFSSHPTLIKSVLESLFENALLYRTTAIGETPTVEVRIYRDGSNLNMSIKDNGEGVSEEIKSEIWTMFYRGNDKATGNGLGLYIARRATKVLKGDISYTTKMGEGTTFKVQLPLHPQALPSSVQG